MADVLIDLGDVAVQERRRVLPDPPPLNRRLVLLVVALVLLAMTAGAVHRGPPAPPVVVPARLGDMTFVSADRLFVVSPGTDSHDSAGTYKIVFEYDLPSGRPLSQTHVAVSGAIFNVAEAGPAILVSYQVDAVGAEATVALVPDTGRELWRRPARLLSASPADGLVLLRENSPQFGNLNWSGVDLATGAIRWSFQQPVRGYTTEDGFSDGFPRMLITATEAGFIEVRDVRTGTVQATAHVPIDATRAGAEVPIWPAGDQLLVSEPSGTTAYALPGLTRRWHSTVDLNGRWLQPDCGGALCSLSWQGGLWVLDPDTGAMRWFDERWNYADEAGRYLLAADEAGSGRTQVISVLDPVSGRVLGNFGQWHAIGAAAGDGTVIGLRERLIDNVVWYAMLDPATQGVRLLGRADDVSGDCQTTTGVLVCRRTDASVGIWTLK